jgi:GrpB-like predicted nucleotidyltransferase (UPF0157 family)
MTSLQSVGGIGLIGIVPYNPAWPALFSGIEAELRARLGSRLDAAHHVGSTSVPGLAAKPKIDIDAVIHGENLQEAVALMRDVPGYTFHGDPYDDGKWTFTRPHGVWGERLYLCATGNPAHEQRLIFPDYLRAHPERADSYAALKRRLAAEAAGRWDFYTSGKSAFVAETLRLAKSHTIVG